MRAALWLLLGCGRVGFAPSADDHLLIDSSSGLADQQLAGDAPLCSTVAELAYNFDGTGSPAWMPVMDMGVSVTESANHLVIGLLNNKAAEGGYNSVCTYDMRGQRVWVTAVTTPRAGTATDMYLGVGTPTQATGVNVTLGSLDAYKLTGNYMALASVPYNASQHKVFQLREAGGTLFWEVSADGVSFTQIYSAAPPFSLAAVNVFIFADAYMPVSNPGTAEFAKFELP